jgi:hypothetical protein
MDHEFLNKTVQEISMSLVFVKPTTVDEKSQGVELTVHKIDASIYSLKAPTASFDTSVNEHMSTGGVEC